jgi:hypothetical protein
MEFKIQVFRDILIYLEKNLSYDNGVDSSKVQIKDYNLDDIAYHFELINEVGFIVGEDVTGFSDKYKIYLIRRLTYPAHEFLTAIRNDTVWNRMVKVSSDIGIEVVKATIPILLDYVKKSLGLV